MQHGTIPSRLGRGATVVALAGGFGLAAPAMADVVYDGTIVRLGGTPVGAPSNGGTISTIDHIAFTVNTAGIISMDLLSWEFNFETNMAQDMNGDGEIAFIDSMIHLFTDDGSLDVGDLIASNDDSSGTLGDGSLNLLDSFLSLNLPTGNYILTVGSFFNSVGDAIAGVNPGNGSGWYPSTWNGSALVVHDHGDYRVTFTGDVTVVPASGAAALLGLGGLVAVGRRRRVISTRGVDDPKERTWKGASSERRRLLS